MGVDMRPFLGHGFMLKKSDMDPTEFDTLYTDMIEQFYAEELFPEKLFYCKDLDVYIDLYCGEWIFIDVWAHGDSHGIVKMPRAFVTGNGDDITLELNRQFGEDHPFLKYATFGTYFGTDWT